MERCSTWNLGSSAVLGMAPPVPDLILPIRANGGAGFPAPPLLWCKQDASAVVRGLLLRLPIASLFGLHFGHVRPFLGLAVPLVAAPMKDARLRIDPDESACLRLLGRE